LSGIPFKKQEKTATPIKQVEGSSEVKKDGGLKVNIYFHLEKCTYQIAPI
jgi:hypothetical protein